MREIKIRVWDNVMNCFHYSDVEPMFSSQASFKRFYVRCEQGIYKWLEGEPQLFIGLIDKRGKEIYEGDIVKLFTSDERFALMEVKFSKGAFNISNLIVFGHKVEVIGNIYESPKLLK